METYPIVIDEELAGKLTVDARGGRTVFNAECRMLPGIVRLSVYGGGKEGYLGVLAPEDGKLRLRKALSRDQMKEFPSEIESAERSGLDRTPEPEQDVGTAHGDAPTQEEQDVGAAHGVAPTQEEQDVGTVHGAAPTQEEQDAGAAHGAAPEETETEPPRELPQEVPEDTEALSWYSSPDGALVCFDGVRNLIALPVGDARIPEGVEGERRTVEGRDYLVYRTKDGRIERG